jgi:hypothetical protein
MSDGPIGEFSDEVEAAAAGARWMSEVDHEMRRVEVHPLFDSEGHILWEDGCPCGVVVSDIDVAEAQGVNAPPYRMWTHNAFDGRE